MSATVQPKRKPKAVAANATLRRRRRVVAPEAPVANVNVPTTLHVPVVQDPGSIPVALARRLDRRWPGVKVSLNGIPRFDDATRDRILLALLDTCEPLSSGFAEHAADPRLASAVARTVQHLNDTRDAGEPPFVASLSHGLVLFEHSVSLLTDLNRGRVSLLTLYGPERGFALMVAQAPEPLVFVSFSK